MSTTIGKIFTSSNKELIKNESLTERIPTLINRFLNEEGAWISKNCQHIKQEGIHYFGIRKDQQPQDRILYQDIKKYVLQTIEMSPDTELIQIVGDSMEYSQEGTKRAKEFLDKNFHSNAAILYGYTGHKNQDGRRCVNASVTDVIEEKKWENRTIGNIVGYHTPMALEKWGCSGPELNAYFIVYGDDETSREKGTVFGDDVITSDFLADRLLVLDGGAQSFRQICNALLTDQKIIVLADLRTPERKHVLENGVQTKYFVAAEFLREASKQEDMQNWYSNYFGKGKVYIADPKKYDFDTKQDLMDSAWKVFIENKLHLKISKLVAFSS